MTHFDVVIVGAGIAGASLAAEIVPHSAVLLIEAETQPGYHTTGRSNAFWHATYGGPLIEPLTSASLDWLQAPPTDVAEAGFLSPRGAVTLARDEDSAALDRFAAGFAGSGVALEHWDRTMLDVHVPGLRSMWTHAVYEEGCHDIDVAAYHAACLRAVRRGGGTISTSTRLESLSRSGSAWSLKTTQGKFTADVIVNAAGAWADVVAEMAGARPIGIQPYRRTIAQIRVGAEVPADMPFVIDVNGGFYFKPASGSIWLSPHDETPSPPCDAAPEELDIAIAIDRFEQVVDWPVRRVEHSWAGLRSFAPDRLPVYGFDPECDGFFWCAGQGGFGIQTAPAGAKLAASLITGNAPDQTISEIDPAHYAPSRFKP
ncbi:MAG: FAD-binding oxidoreductase [Pseudomonadota bacterium]